MTSSLPALPGKPTHGVGYTPAIADAIFERLVMGEGLTKICEDEGMPSKQAVFNWMRIIPGFRDAYEAAKLIGVDAQADDVVDIADACETAEDAQIAKVRIAARQWRAEKLNPKKFGLKGDVNVGGGLQIIIRDVLDDE